MASAAPITLLRDGETPEEALRRLERRRDYTKVIGTDEGQRLLEAATAQVKATPNGGIKAKSNGKARTTVPRETPAVDAITAAQAISLSTMPVDQLHIGDNVRVNVEGIDELAASIASHGVLQPIKVKDIDGRWTVVWGQRRLLAARKAGLARIPVMFVSHLEPNDPAERAIEQLIENLHRADLPPLDRAHAMRAVVDAGKSQADLARELGLHPSTVANDLGLLEAPAPVQKLILSGELSPSHAKALKGLAPKTQGELGKWAAESGVSAHRLEEEVQRRKRIAEEDAQRKAQEREQQKAQLEAIRTAIADVAAKPKPGLDADVVVHADYEYDRTKAELNNLAGMFREAGFTSVRVLTGYNAVAARAKGICDCTAWKARLTSTYSYATRGYVSKLQFTPACVKPKHREAQQGAASRAEREKYALQNRVTAHVKKAAAGYAFPGAGSTGGTAIAVDRLLAEAALWSILSYRLPAWSEQHGGKRNRPWDAIRALSDEDLAKELATEIAGDFRDKAGYHVDWSALAEELGVKSGLEAVDAAAEQAAE